MPVRLLLAGAWWAVFATVAFGDDAVGHRPYEMEWAGRITDTREALIDFESVVDWQTECHDAAAAFSRSREQQLWGQYVGKLVYRGTSKRPQIIVRPPQPVELTMPLDCLNLWVYGNNWGWRPDPSTPQVEIRVLLQSDTGVQVPVAMGRVRWKEWWLMHQRLTAEQLSQLGTRPFFVGLEVAYGANDEDRTIFFDNLSVYKEPLPQLQFAARPRRGIELPPGQTVGLNQGPGQLPFPTRAETILPDNLTSNFQVSLEEMGSDFVFRYQGDDGQLIYRYRPDSGTLGDISAEWVGRGQPLRPLDQGGVRFWSENETAVVPEPLKLVRCQREGDAVVSVWDCRLGPRQAEVTYRFQLWQKSLVIDIHSETGEVGEFHVGRVVGSQTPRLVTLPYLTGAEQRAAVLVSGPETAPLFLSSLVDHCRSNSSEFWFANRVVETDDDAWVVIQNGGSRYLPRTDGVRNPCFERLFLTVSPRFEEVLPNIPNPVSPWKSVTGQCVWRAHGASDRERDYEHWRKVARYGMTKVAITDHETGWRDGGESFTMRTRAAPGKGGDRGQAQYAQRLLALGFRYGIYNNYTDYAPVNQHWDEDYVTRLSDGQWRTAWPRCYNPKPARAVELEAQLAPIIQQKFHLNTAYCDVHTAVRPWSYVDYDARVPGAATFAATFYAYGEIMLHQKATWQGPVYSEGNNHWYYCGLTDGNYGQDQLGRLNERPWLVDFDLRKMHPLCCNFGMGNPGMFFGDQQGLGSTAEQRQANLDRFLAATLAFGHTGFLVFEDGFENAIRSYYSVQQIHARYAEQEVTSIQYADAEGHLLDTSQAVATGAYGNSRIVTKYQDGLQVIVNGHTGESWQFEGNLLPPGGWLVRDPGVGRLTAYSKLVEGHRVDFVDAPDYLYANGRGRLTRFEQATCDGQLVLLRRDDGCFELIPVGKGTVCGVSLAGRTARAMALDEAGRELGTAAVRTSRGLVYVTQIPGAVSYLLTPQDQPANALTCPRVAAIPGEIVQVDGAAESAFKIPASATVGQQVWYESNGQWIDFSICPLASVTLSSVAPLRFEIVSHLADEAEAEIGQGSHTARQSLMPEQREVVEFPSSSYAHESVQEVPLKIAAGGLTHQQSWWIKTEATIRELATLDRDAQTGQCLRDGEQTEVISSSGAQVYRTSRACGGEEQNCLFMHPPYRNGTGSAFAVMKSVELPDDSPAAFRCVIGKADGSDPGDGVLFRVLVIDRDGNETLVAEKSWGQHSWTPLEANLARWAGQPVRVKLVADAGAADNSVGDWGCWAQLRIEDLHPVLVSSIHSAAVSLTREPGPSNRDDLTMEQVRSAKHATLRFQGIGVQAGGGYISSARLNGLTVGPLPAAGGDERNGVWQDAQIELPRSVVRNLHEWNELIIENPLHDSFKIRRCYIELELDDGQSASSHVTTTVFSQPDSWLFAEGTGVPQGAQIRIKIRIPLAR